VLWEGIVDSVALEGIPTWPGWLLIFAANIVLEGNSCKRMQSQQQRNPYKNLCKPLQLCWKLEPDNNSTEIGAGGYSEYSPVFSLDKLCSHLSEINNVEMFGNFESLRTASMEGSIVDSVEIIGIIGDCLLYDDEQNEFLPLSFMVCTVVVCIFCFATIFCIFLKLIMHVFQFYFTLDSL